MPFVLLARGARGTEPPPLRIIVFKRVRDNQPLKSVDLFTRRAHNYTSTRKSLYVREELDGTTQCANKHMLSTPGLGEVHDYRDVLLRLRSSPCYVFAER